MAVHTPLNREIIAEFLQPYQLGELHSFVGISDGIENTNYLLTLKTAKSKNTPAQYPFAFADYILTVFETIPANDIGFYIELMNTLAANGLPVPQPIFNPDNKSALQTLMNKPALLLSRLIGTHPRVPTAAQCQAIGHVLARQHLLTQDLQHPGEQALIKILNDGRALLPTLNSDEQQLLNEELDRAEQFLTRTDLPRGLIHGDLFRDNTLFCDDQLTGLLDYYSATVGPWLLDVAIAANDWCNTENRLDGQRLAALLEGYQQIRPLTGAEQAAWQDCLRCAALRFWISRLTNPLRPKDPDEFRKRLINLRKSLI